MYIFNDPFEFKKFVQDKNDLLTVPQISEIVNEVNSLVGGCNCNVKSLIHHIEYIYRTANEWMGQGTKDSIKVYLNTDKVTMSLNGRFNYEF